MSANIEVRLPFMCHVNHVCCYFTLCFSFTAFYVLLSYQYQFETGESCSTSHQPTNEQEWVIIMRWCDQQPILLLLLPPSRCSAESVIVSEWPQLEHKGKTKLQLSRLHLCYIAVIDIPCGRQSNVQFVIDDEPEQRPVTHVVFLLFATLGQTATR